MRTHVWRATLALLLAGVALILPLQGAQAQEPNRAGLVVVKGDGSVLTRCVEFADESVSGYDLLAASGLEVSSEPGAMGATICSLDGEGCSFPQKSCFCQCQGSPCVYWSYWTLGADGWTYANLGAGNQRVRDGDVQGWVWGAGTTGSAPEPPATAFGDICLAPESAEVAAAGTATQPVTAAAPASTGAPQVESGESSGITWLWVLGAAALPLLLLLALCGRRQEP